MKCATRSSWAARFAAVVLLGLGSLAPSAQADPMYFSYSDPDRTVWDSTTTDWASASGGPYDSAWVDGSAAHFEGTAGAVSVSGTISSVDSITFDSDGYTLNGGTITLPTLGGVVTTGSGTDTINSTIAGSGGLTKYGSGTLILGGNNTYSSVTSVMEGTLAYGVNNAIGSGGVTVAGGTLALGNYSDTVGPVRLISGSITSTGGVLTGTSYVVKKGTCNAVLAGSADVPLFKSSADTVVLAAANTYGGLTTIQPGGGTLQLGDGIANNGSVAGNIVNDAALVFANPNAQTYAGAISGSGTLTKQGAGTLTLTGANTYTGATTISAGTLLISGANDRLPTSTALTLADVSGAVLQLNNHQTIGSLSGGGSNGGNIALGSRTLTVGDSSSTTYAGVISGTGALTKQGSGTLTLAGQNTYTGLTTISAGTLAYGVNNAISPSNTGQLTINGDTAVLDLGSYSGSINSAVRLINGAITGTGTLTATAYVVRKGTISANLGGAGVALTKSTADTVILSGTNLYTGATNITLGTLQVDGSLANSNTTVSSGAMLDGSGSIAGAVSVLSGATLAAGTDGTVGTLTLSNTLSLADGAILKFDLAGIGASDKVAMSSTTLTLNGQEFADFIFTPQAGFGAGVYTLIDAGGISGSLGSVLSGTIGGKLATLSVDVGNSDLLLTVVPEPGSWTIVISGLMGLIAYAWRRRR